MNEIEMSEYVRSLEKLKSKAVMIREETGQYVKDINSILDLALYFKKEEREEFIKKASKAVLSRLLETMLEIFEG